VPKAVAAFPWIACDERIEIGPVRIIPYKRGSAPGDLPHAKQADLDAMLAAYADLPKQLVGRASLLEIDNWYTGMDAGEHAVRLFDAREAIAFAALSKRRLFRGHFDYCNTHAYILVAQRYLPGQAGRFMFYTRRRDTGTSHMWATDMFAHQRPSHVPNNSKCQLDRPLLAALLKLDDRSPLREAIREFNCANTDSDDVPEHVEVVMVKSAFEWLFGINTSAQEFVEALVSRLSPVLGSGISEGPMSERWRKRWEKAQRPIEAWARDFCDVRGAAAHGERFSGRFVWRARSHLAFASILFPLAMKKQLADDSLLQLDDSDREQLLSVEQLLMTDPFSAEALSAMRVDSHPWSEILDQAYFNARANRMFRKVESSRE